jgi:Derlin-2/3
MNLISSYYVAFIYEKVVTLRALPEIWRLVTPFFITGPQFGLLMDPYFLWTYASQLELEATRFSQPGDFFTYITFVCSVILVSLAHFPPLQA